MSYDDEYQESVTLDDLVMSVLGSWLGVFLASRVVAAPMRTQ